MVRNGRRLVVLDDRGRCAHGLFVSALRFRCVLRMESGLCFRNRCLTRLRLNLYPLAICISALHLLVHGDAIRAFALVDLLRRHLRAGNE